MQTRGLLVILMTATSCEGLQQGATPTSALESAGQTGRGSRRSFSFVSLTGREVTLGWQRFSCELRAGNCRGKAGAGNKAREAKKGTYTSSERVVPEST